MRIARLIVLSVLLLTGVAHGGIWNNSGTTGEDSISFRGALLDSLGNPVQIDTAADWGYLSVYYPGGDSCYSDSFVIAQSDAHIEVYTSAEFVDRKFTYKDAVANVDGAGIEGVYTWDMHLRDSSLALDTWLYGEFQLYATTDYSTWADRLDETISTRTVVGNNLSGAAAADAVWDEDRAGHTTQDTYGAGLDTLIARVPVAFPSAAPGAAGGLVTAVNAGAITYNGSSVPVVDVASISGDGGAADALESIFDSTGGARLDVGRIKIFAANDTAISIRSTDAGANPPTVHILGTESSAGTVVIESSGSAGGPALKLDSEGSNALYLTSADASAASLHIEQTSDGDAIHLTASGFGDGLDFQDGSIGGGSDALGNITGNITTVTTANNLASGSITDAVIAADAITFDAYAGTEPTVWWNEGKTGYSLSSPQTFDITGNITGNLSGSVGSVTGNVGGSVASVTADVGLSDAELAAIADTVLERKAHQTTDTSTIGGIIHATGDSLISQEWATSAASDTTGAAASVWAHGTRTLTTADWAVAGDNMGLTTGATGDIADSVWRKGYAQIVAAATDGDTTMAYAIKEIRDSLQHMVTATGFTVPGDVVTLQADSLATLFAWIDAMRDSLQYLVTATGFSTHGPGNTADSVWRKGYAQLMAAATDGDTTMAYAIKEIRDSLQFLVTGAGGSQPWTAAGVDSVYDFATAWSNKSLFTEGADSVWTSTGGDSVLQALDYTNNTHEVVRQVVSTVANVTLTATTTNSTQAEADIAALNDLSDTQLRDAIGDSTTVWKDSSLSFMAATTDTLKAIKDSIEFVMDSLAAQIWATSGSGVSEATVRTIIGDSTTVWKDSSLSFMAATTDTLKAIKDSIEFIMDSLAAQTWATSGSGVSEATVRTIIGDSTTAWKDSNLSFMAAMTDTVKAIKDSIEFIMDSLAAQGWAATADVSGLATAAALATAQADLDTPNQYKSTGFAVSGDPMTLQSDSLATLFAWVDAVRDSLQYLVGVGLQDGDSLRLRRWVWDSTSGIYGNYARVVDTTKVAEGVSATVDTAQIRAMMDDLLFADSNIARNSTAADYKADVSGCGSGAGVQIDSVWVYDTSGTDAAIPYAKVTVQNSDSSQAVATGYTDANGVVVFNLDASTAYIFVVGNAPGYTVPSLSISTGAGASDSILVQGYNITIASAGSPTLKGVYNYEYKGGTLAAIADSGVVVTAILLGPSSFQDSVLSDTVSGVSYSFRSEFKDTSDGNGLWNISVPLNSYIVPAGTYWEFKAINTSGRRTRWTTQVTASDTTTECITKAAGITDDCKN